MCECNSHARELCNLSIHKLQNKSCDETANVLSNVQTDEGDDDLKKGTQLLEIYALEIQMYTAQVIWKMHFVNCAQRTRPLNTGCESTNFDLSCDVSLAKVTDL